VGHRAYNTKTLVSGSFFRASSAQPHRTMTEQDGSTYLCMRNKGTSDQPQFRSNDHTTRQFTHPQSFPFTTRLGHQKQPVEALGKRDSISVHEIEAG
jgi:hypothetical protein